jgi:hypothetical protein
LVYNKAKKIICQFNGKKIPFLFLYQRRHPQEIGKKRIREGLGKREGWRKKRRKVRKILRKRPKKWFNKRLIFPNGVRG